MSRESCCHHNGLVPLFLSSSIAWSGAESERTVSEELVRCTVPHSCTAWTPEGKLVSRHLLPPSFPHYLHEVIAALPKFIRLTPNVVRGVFDKLLVSYKGTHSNSELLVCSMLCSGDQSHSMSPVTPSELLIALHNIDCRNDEATLKAVVRGMLAAPLSALSLE